MENNFVELKKKVENVNADISELMNKEKKIQRIKIFIWMNNYFRTIKLEEKNKDMDFLLKINLSTIHS